jgi:hypothetical protein
MTTETNGNRPTQRVYAVIKKEGNEKVPGSKSVPRGRTATERASA